MRYGNGAEVLHDVRLRLAAGSFHFLIGPSGAGKTSLLRVLALAQPISRGRLPSSAATRRSSTGPRSAACSGASAWCSRISACSTISSAFENVALPLRLAGADDEQITGHVGELLGWLGLGEVVEKPPGELSMGQRQLVAVGRAVVGRPSLLLADEPTSSVDTGHARRLMHLLLSLHRLGTTVIVATHNERLVRQHGFAVLEMAKGRLLGPAPVTAMAVGA